jgi:hypothetical protein
MKLTQEQIKGVRGYLIELLLPIFGDAWDREEVIDLVMADVVTDIEETADWSELEDDEVHTGDVEIALARVLKAAVVFNYTGE